MTRDELFLKHCDAIVAREDHVPITIDYTLEVLDDILKKATHAFNGGEIINIIYNKLNEVKSLRS